MYATLETITRPSAQDADSHGRNPTTTSTYWTRCSSLSGNWQKTKTTSFQQINFRNVVTSSCSWVDTQREPSPVVESSARVSKG